MKRSLLSDGKNVSLNVGTIIPNTQNVKLPKAFFLYGEYNTCKKGHLSEMSWYTVGRLIKTEDF